MNLMDHASLILFIESLAHASGDVIKKYFRKTQAIDTKPDSTPVTLADRQSELIMRQMIQNRFPDHGILGEEFEEINKGAEYQWILDPIDGTKSFISGTYLFGTLIALLKDGKPVIGAVNNPITNQFLIGDRSKTWLNGVPVSVRHCDSIEDATLLTTNPLTVHQYHDGDAFEKLIRKVKLFRTWGDCHGYYLVASGYADIMIDAAMHIWDVAALIPVIEGAGGIITDYRGNDPLGGVGAIATSVLLHEDIIKALNP